MYIGIRSVYHIYQYQCLQARLIPQIYILENSIQRVVFSTTMLLTQARRWPDVVLMLAYRHVGNIMLVGTRTK